MRRANLQSPQLDLTLASSYDSCDVGVMPNQTDATGPPAATIPLVATELGGRGREEFNYQLSMLPGQRLRSAHRYSQHVLTSDNVAVHVPVKAKIIQARGLTASIGFAAGVHPR